MNVKTPILDQCTLALDSQSEITMEALAPYFQRNKNKVFPHRHNFYHFVLFTEGSGTYSIDFERFDVLPWQIYFMTPGQIHTWEFGEDVDGYVVNFETETFQTLLLRPDYINSLSFFSGRTEDYVYDVSERLQQSIRHVFEETLLHTKHTDFVKISVLYILELLRTQVEVHTKPSIGSYHSTILQNFRNLIEKHYNELRLPKEYAALLYITPNHLNALCKEFLGEPAGEVIRNRVLLEAKRLLVLQGYSISEIAYQLNFNDNSYFTKFFKKLEGITPEEFRKRYSS